MSGLFQTLLHISQRSITLLYYCVKRWCKKTSFC